MKNVMLRGLAIVAAVLVMAPRLASAQVNLVGYWNPLVADEDFIERMPGPNVGDYAGLPITDAARKRRTRGTRGSSRCRSTSASRTRRPTASVASACCASGRSANPLTQQLMRLKTHIQWQEQERDIWMDGRPEPSELEPHTWQGFSTDGSRVTCSWCGRRT